MTVSKAKATQVLKKVEQRFAAWVEEGYEPSLVEGWSGYEWAVIWESGPSDWTMAFTSGDTTEEERFLVQDVMDEFQIDRPLKIDRIPNPDVPGVYAEPYNGSVLVLFPN